MATVLVSNGSEFIETEKCKNALVARLLAMKFRKNDGTGFFAGKDYSNRDEFQVLVYNEFEGENELIGEY